MSDVVERMESRLEALVEMTEPNGPSWHPEPVHRGPLCPTPALEPQLVRASYKPSRQDMHACWARTKWRAYHAASPDCCRTTLISTVDIILAFLPLDQDLALELQPHSASLL